MSDENEGGNEKSPGNSTLSGGAIVQANNISNECPVVMVADILEELTKEKKTIINVRMEFPYVMKF